MGTIRLLLALLVALAHTNEGPSYGVGAVAAVNAFFIISGFYMALVLNTKYAGRPNFIFYRARFLRIYPLYWLTLIGTMVVTAVIGEHFNALGYSWSRLHDQGIAAYLVASMLTLAGLNWVQIFGLGVYVLNNPAWTLSLEVTFYAMAPFIVRRPLGQLSFLFALGMGLRGLLWVFGYSHLPWDHALFPFEFVYFVAGALAFRLSQAFAMPRLSISIGLWAALVFLTAAWRELFTAYSMIEPSWLGNFYYLLLAIAMPAIFSWSGSRRINGSPWLEWLRKTDSAFGELSYPTYITHILTTSVMAYYQGRMAIGVHPIPWQALNVACVLAVAAIGWNAVRPIERIRVNLAPSSRFHFHRPPSLGQNRPGSSIP